MTDTTAILARLRAADVDCAARAICRETCAFMGEPACFDVTGDDGAPLPWPNPNCDEPGCHALALAAITAREARE